MEKNNYIDLLTDLHNRNFLITNMNEFVSTIIKNYSEGESWSLLYCDINGLKKINDTLGHEVSDKSIELIAKIIKKNIRLVIPKKEIAEKRKGENSDKVIHRHPIRYGGDEFVIILSDCKKEEAIKVKDRIQNEIDKNKDYTFGMTLSIGVANTIELENNPQILNNLIKLAEKRMYAEKKRYYRNFSDDNKKTETTDEITTSINKYYEILELREVKKAANSLVEKLLEDEMIISEPHKKVLKNK